MRFWVREARRGRGEEEESKGGPREGGCIWSVLEVALGLGGCVCVCVDVNDWRSCYV